MKKIFADENINCIQESLINSCELTIYSGRMLTNQDLIESQCEYLLTRSQTKVNRELLQNTMVRFVATATSGTDHFDVEYLTTSGILYADAKGSNANSVAEYVIYGLLHWAHLNKLHLADQTIGIIGYGCIGKLVAKYSYLLGIRVIVNDPPLKDIGFEFPDYVEYMELDELVRDSTIITNHVPLTTHGKYPTKYLLDESIISMIKDNSLFIHASRGGVIQESALLNAIEKRKLTAIIDVWENEPQFDFEMANSALIATPHVAGYSFDGKLRGTEMILDALEKNSEVIANRALLNHELQKYTPLSENEFKNSMYIYNALSQSRKILEDSTNFKSICNPELIESRKIEFDNLRKTYPLRREIL